MTFTKAFVDERQIIRDTADILSRYGTVNIEPITDSLNPHVGRQVPELVFVPESGPNQGIVHIVEFKSANSEILPSVIVSNARQYKRWIQEANPEITVRYALSSNGKVLVDEEPDVTPLTEIHDAEELAQRVVVWSGAEEEHLELASSGSLSAPSQKQ